MGQRKRFSGGWVNRSKDRSENRSISTLEELYETRNKDLTRKACFTGVGIF